MLLAASASYPTWQPAQQQLPRQLGPQPRQPRSPGILGRDGGGGVPTSGSAPAISAVALTWESWPARAVAGKGGLSRLCVCSHADLMVCVPRRLGVCTCSGLAAKGGPLQ